MLRLVGVAMVDFVLSAFVVALALVGLLAITRGLGKDKRRILFLGLAAKTVAAIALMSVIKYYYGYGDMLSFLREGRALVRYMDYSGFSGLQDTVAIVFQQDVAVPVRIHGVGRSTGSMAALAGLLLYVLDSDWAVSIVFAMVGFAGQVALTLAFWRQLPEQHTKLVGFACLFVPSLAFWSAGVVKETIAVGGLGIFTFALLRFVESRYLSGVVLALLAVVLVWLSKPFLLLALTCGVAAGGYVHRASGGRGRFRVRPIALVFWALVAFAALFAIGEIFPRYSLADMAQQVAIEQAQFDRVAGGSDFEVDSYADRSVFEQVLFAPLALVTSCFRPFLFEARNVVMLANALESTAFLVLFVLVWRRNGFRLVGRLLSSPTLTYAFVVACVIGMGVGLTTTNMGTLSRYRIPMLPFFVVVLLILRAKQGSHSKISQESERMPSVERPMPLGNSVRS